MRQVVLLISLVLLTVALAIWGALQFVETPAGTIRLATGGPGSPYTRLAQTWSGELRRFGVTLELRTQEGAGARGALLAGDVDAAFLIGGFSASHKWFSYGLDLQIMDEESELRSLGRMFDEPLWVYYRRQVFAHESLQGFKGKRILIGTQESGTADVVRMLLHANGIPEDDRPAEQRTKLIESIVPDDAGPLVGEPNASDAADVAFFFMPSNSGTVKTLLDSPEDILLMDFTDVADAYVGKFPFLSTVVMPRGAHSFDPQIVPTANITLLTAAPALVVRKDLHPALVTLLTHVSVVKPKSGIDPKTGYPVMFHKPGKYPHINDPEYEVHEHAKAYYKSGALPLVLRSIGPTAARHDVPFWVTAVASQHGTQILLLAIPILSILVPLSRAVPALYTWVMRRRLLRWYDRLKTLETTVSRADATPGELTRASDELQTIDDAVRRLRIARPFSDRLYELRTHISLVEQRLSRRRHAGQ